MKRLAPWLAVSLIVAGGSLFSFRVFIDGHWLKAPWLSTWWLGASLLLSALWMIVFVSSLIAVRWRGLWLLMGMPGVIFGPLMLAGLAQSIDKWVAGAEPGMETHCFP
ncbi:MAG TPA: hypothetical protein VN809_02320 [Telmatospirillum sp.]|nr:hypothetical protein [Telmatospirillum sp.]